MLLIRTGGGLLTFGVFMLLGDGKGVTLGFIAWLAGHVTPDFFALLGRFGRAFGIGESVTPGLVAGLARQVAPDFLTLLGRLWGSLDKLCEIGR